jgi:hypothetical protein
MPVSGIADPDQHRICIRCGQWFEPDEGEVIPLERGNPVGRMADAVSGDVRMRFRCDVCTRELERRKLAHLIAIAAILLVAVGFAINAYIRS